MIELNADSSGWITLQTRLNSFTKFNTRGINVIAVAHSDVSGFLTVQVIGRRGMATKNAVIMYDSLDETWIVSSDGVNYYMNDLREIRQVITIMVNSMKTTVKKI